MQTNILPNHADTSLPHPKYRADIDGLRAIAVLAVIGFHAFPAWVKGGFIGVDVFFVISGYLISSIIFCSLDKGGFSFMEFYSRRIRRIFPALVLMLAACYAFGWFVLLPNEYKQLGKHMASGAGFVSNFALWSESGYFDTEAATKPLLHLWSLGIEEQFYIVWPLLLYWVWKLRSNLLALTILIVVASFWLNISKACGDAVAAFYSPLTRFWELLAGSILAYVTLYGQSLFAQTKPHPAQPDAIPAREGAARREIKSVVGLALIAVAIFVLNRDMAFPGWWALLPATGAYLLIAASPQAWLNRNLLSHRVLVWFGLISYPLYLWHWPLLAFARIVEPDTPSNKIRIAAVAASIVLAWLTYRLVEKPFRFGKRGKMKTASLCLLMLVAGSVGYFTYQRDGLGFRFPKIIQDLSSFRYDYKTEYREGTCFLRPEQDESAFGNCVDQPPTPASASVFLWGDSHAAHLYPGLKRVMGHDFRLTQLTASLCAPILGVYLPERPHCKDINNYIFDRIIREKPDRVILAAMWGWNIANDKGWKKLPYTIEQLRKGGIKRIDLVGPVPLWKGGKGGLPNNLSSFIRQDKMLRMPLRMSYGLSPITKSFDRGIRDFAVRFGVNYISVYEIFCNEEGCLTRTGEDVSSLTQWDETHLTTAGSEFLASHFLQ